MMYGVRKTNTQFVTELMEFSKTGALMQAFVITAIEKYAEQCIKAGPATFDSPLMSGEAWHATAKEAQERLQENYRN